MHPIPLFCFSASKNVFRLFMCINVMNQSCNRIRLIHHTKPCYHCILSYMVCELKFDLFRKTCLKTIVPFNVPASHNLSLKRSRQHMHFKLQQPVMGTSATDFCEIYPQIHTYIHMNSATKH